MDDGCHPAFCGNYDPVEIGEGGDNTKLYFSDRNTLYWPNGAMTINPFRAYFQLNTATANARSIVLDFGDGTQTSIGHTEITDITEKPDAWYSLDGRKLQGKPTTKGVYINNGRSVVIK